MAFNMPTSGNGWRLAASLVQLGHEVAAAHPDFTCLGTIGDASHATQGASSDHNPFVQFGGLGIVRAIDIGGPDAELKALRQYLWDLYAQSDDRLFEFGYVKGCSDNQINNWGLPFGHHEDDGDASHLHISVTQKDGNNPSAAGYVDAIDSTRTWGISGAVLLGSGTPTPPAPAVKLWQGYPVPALIAHGTGNYFGDIDGPDAEHGGINQSEQTYVRILQQRLIVCGFVPGVTNPNDGWADGIFNAKDGHIGGPTTDAVTRFQQAHMPGTQFYGQVWDDDWTTLFNL